MSSAGDADHVAAEALSALAPATVAADTAAGKPNAVATRLRTSTTGGRGAAKKGFGLETGLRVSTATPRGTRGTAAPGAGSTRAGEVVDPQPNDEAKSTQRGTSTRGSQSRKRERDGEGGDNDEAGSADASKLEKRRRQNRESAAVCRARRKKELADARREAENLRQANFQLQVVIRDQALRVAEAERTMGTMWAALNVLRSRMSGADAAALPPMPNPLGLTGGPGADSPSGLASALSGLTAAALSGLPQPAAPGAGATLPHSAATGDAAGSANQAATNAAADQSAATAVSARQLAAVQQLLAQQQAASAAHSRPQAGRASDSLPFAQNSGRGPMQAPPTSGPMGAPPSVHPSLQMQLQQHMLQQQHQQQQLRMQQQLAALQRGGVQFSPTAANLGANFSVPWPGGASSTPPSPFGGMKPGGHFN